MTVKQGFYLREIGDTRVLIAIGQAARDFGGIAYINETGALIINGLNAGKNREEIIEDLLTQFSADKPRVEADYDAFVKRLSDEGILQC